MSNQYSRRFLQVLALIVGLAVPGRSLGQFTITGDTCVVAGTQYTYTIAGSWTSGTTMTWSVTGGTISGTNTGTPLPQVHVTWSTTTIGTIAVTCSNPSGSGSLNVTAAGKLNAFTTPFPTQFIYYNTIPAFLALSNPTGGNCAAPNYQYQWQNSSDDVAFASIAGATESTLAFSTGLTSTEYYRRLVRETNTGDSAYSDTMSVIVYPPFTSAGTLSPSSTVVNYGVSPGLLTLSGMSGGSGSYTYTWEASEDSVNWVGAPGSDFDTTVYLSPPLGATTYFRVLVWSGVYLSSTTATVTVKPELFPGIIGPSNVSILSGSSPGLLSANPASGGSCSGAYNYQWQNSTDGKTWSSISGADSLTYSPGNLSATIYYRQRVVCGTDTEYSNIGTVEIVSSTDLNFIRTRDIRKTGVTDSVTAASLTSPYDVSQVTQYFDGLGRPTQTVAMQQTPLGKDLIMINDYDNYGREIHKFLPFSDTSASGNYKYSGPADQYAFNAAQYPNEQYYYGLVSMEPSPLNRPLTSYAQGISWVGSNRGDSSRVLVNQGSDSVRLWTIAYSVGSIPTTTSTYAPGTLRESITTDEAGHRVVTYSDLEGRVILKKVQQTGTPGSAHVGWLCTYYVYDDMGLLRFVIQPQAVALINSSWSISGTIADQLCFRYNYDQWGRMNIKKVPGAGEVHLVYDERDRLVMSQDSNMRAAKQWHVSSYDVENRPDSTGLIADPTNFNNLAYHTAAAMATTPYPAISGFTYTPLTQTHYDDYAWVSAVGSLTATMDTSYDANGTFFIHSYTTSPYAIHQTPFYITRGMVTGTMQYLLGVRPQYTVNFYDDRGRVLETQRHNYYGNPSFDRDINQYSFSGLLLRHLLVTEKGTPNAQTNLQNDQYTYDAAFRPTIVTMAYIDGYNFVVDTLKYDELGRLHVKSLGGRIDSLVYSYNVRGWVSGINKNYVAGTANDYFGLELAYDKQTSVSTTSYAAAQFNGNITGLIWKSAGDGINRKYDFTYDSLSRLTGATFLQNPSGSTWNTAAMDYSVGGLTYDANGNILSMNQNGFRVGNPTGAIDQLSYAYNTSSNQLSKVTDAANDSTSTLGDFHYKTKGSFDYTYDGNGNLKSDNNKGIDSIGYNYLNLPQYIHIKGKGTITYAYDANGLKEAKVTVDSTVSPVKRTTTVYVENFQYTNDTLTQASLADGRARWQKQYFLNGDSAWHFFFDYFLKDHLGNTRVVLTGEKDTANYMATMESAYRTKENALFYNVDSTSYPAASVPGGYPTDNTTVPNDSVAMVEGNPGGHTQGPALLLKVMTGDSISIGVKSYYLSGGSTSSTSNSLNSVLNTLAGGLVALGGGGGHGTLANLNNTSGSPAYNALNTYFYPTYDSTPGSKPKAYLNWMLLDNQFNYVSGSNQSGAIPVGSANVLNTLATTIKLKHSGYLYIWVSNETQNWMVFFDNLAVQDFSGPMVEENHYYPFGLSMAGISDKALKRSYSENKYRFNKGSELQNKEFNDGSGLEMYETHLRELDPQLGRWWQIDSKPTMAESPYSAMGNNPILHYDQLGDTLTPSQQKTADEDYRRANASEGTAHFHRSTEYQRENYPIGAALNDAGYYLAKVFGLTTADQAVSTITDKNASLGDKVLAVANVAVATSRGEGEGVEGDGPVELHIDPEAHPEAAAHAEEAIKNGVSGEGVIDRAGRDARRSENLSGVPTRKGADRDEFPPAVINNGGAGQSVQHINPSDNRGAGASLGAQIRNLPDNTRVIIVIRAPKKE